MEFPGEVITSGSAAMSTKDDRSMHQLADELIARYGRPDPVEERDQEDEDTLFDQVWRKLSLTQSWQGTEQGVEKILTPGHHACSLAPCGRR
jgi:hypothetical protein